MATTPSILNPAPQTAAAVSRAQKVRAGAYVRRIDWVLVAAVAGIAAIGLQVIATGTRNDPLGSHYYVLRHEINLALGGLGAAILVFVPPQLYRRLQWPLFGVMLGLIAVVLAIGASTRGAARWITLPGFQLQPSELGKLLLVLTLAAFIADRRDSIGSWRLTAAAVAYAGAAAALVFLEPDFGTAIVYGASALTMLWIAGARVRHFAALGAIAVVVTALVFSILPGAGINVVRSYQLDRMTAFLHPNADPQGAGYNQYQTRVAIGSGGIAGRGASGATQTAGDFLPEHHTDFVFAVLGETRGFVGATLLIGLFLVVIWRTLRAITVAETLFGALVAAGITGWLLASVFINVGMTIGLAPITGIPLPLVSYGGSSTITLLWAFGVLQAIQLRGRMAADLPRAGGVPRRRRRSSYSAVR